MRRGLLLAALLAGCGRDPDPPAASSSAGSRLEAAAIRAGLVVDPAARTIAGAWALETDRACIVAQDAGAARVGLLIDYGQGQGCVARGTVRRRGDMLDLALGEGCRVAARFDGARIVLPAEVPAACDRVCTGRATLAAMTVERQSKSVAEALSLRSPAGRPLCAG